jgi:hypothetical protein
MTDPVAFLKTQLGMDVISLEGRLPEGAVRSAINVELNEKSGFRRRPGYTQRLAGACLGIYQPENMPGLAIYVDQASRELRRITETGYATLAHDAYELWPIEHAHYLYVAVGSRVLRIDPDFSCRSAGIANLIGFSPTLVALNNGGLAPGTYLVAVSYHNDLGEESGLSNTSQITLASGYGAIDVFLPPPPDEAVMMSIYRTYANGRNLFRVATVEADTSFAITLSVLGRPARTWLRAPLPSGILASYQGRLYSASGTFVYYSEPFNTNLMNVRSGFIPFGERTTMVLAVTDGLYVGTDSAAYYLGGGGPSEFRIRLVDPHPVMFGSGIMVDGAMFSDEFMRQSPRGQETAAVAVWLSPHGAVAGMVGGNVATPMQERITLRCRKASGSSIIRRGLHQLIFATEGLELGLGGNP